MKSLATERASTLTPERSNGRSSLEAYDELFSRATVTHARRDSVRRRLLAVADVLGICAAYGCVWLVAPPNARLSERLALGAVLPAWIVLNKLIGLYDRDANLIHKSTLDEVPSIALSAIVGSSLLFMLAQPIFGFDPGRTQTLAFIGFAIIWCAAFRGLVRASVVSRSEPERCLIIGSGFVADLLARKLAGHPEYGVKLVGYVDVAYPEQQNGSNCLSSRLGDLERLEEICHEFRVERVVIAFSSLSHEDLIQAIRMSKTLQLKISVVPRLFEVIGHSVEVDQLEGMTLLGLRGFSRTRSSLWLKRAIDIAGSAAGLIALSPLLLAVGVAIKATSRGPVFFKQRRVGRDRAFNMIKFRTMVHGADQMKSELTHLNEAERPMFKIPDDPRVTPIGRFLRRRSIDELPQLWNVLRGEMSLVGPRPLVPREDDHVIGHHRERLSLTPGLTGPWQVLGRSQIPFQEMVKLDYLYVAEWSLWNDLKLLIRTAPVMLRANGH